MNNHEQNLEILDLILTDCLTLLEENPPENGKSTIWRNHQEGKDTFTLTAWHITISPNYSNNAETISDFSFSKKFEDELAGGLKGIAINQNVICSLILDSGKLRALTCKHETTGGNSDANRATEPIYYTIKPDEQRFPLFLNSFLQTHTPLFPEHVQKLINATKSPMEALQSMNGETRTEILSEKVIV